MRPIPWTIRQVHLLVLFISVKLVLMDVWIYCLLSYLLSILYHCLYCCIPESFLDGSIDCAELITDTGADPDLVWLTISLTSSLLLLSVWPAETVGFFSVTFCLLSLLEACCSDPVLLVSMITSSIIALLVSCVEVVPDAISRASKYYNKKTVHKQRFVTYEQLHQKLHVV